MKHPPCRRRRRRRLALHARPITISLLVALAKVGARASAAADHANFFTFADNGSFIDGVDDSWPTRSRAVVDSGFVHRPIGIGSRLTDWTWQAKASAISDFDRTATLSTRAPDGYTFTSQWGVLLSMPESATWPSMFAGLGVIAAFVSTQGTRVHSARARRATVVCTRVARATHTHDKPAFVEDYLPC